MASVQCRKLKQLMTASLICEAYRGHESSLPCSDKFQTVFPTSYPDYASK